MSTSTALTDTALTGTALTETALPSTGVATQPDWMVEVPTTAPRGRVVRADDPLVRIVDLPSVEDLAEGEDADDDDNDEDAALSGGAAVAWALGYRSGHETGHAEGWTTGVDEGRREGLERATAEATARYAEVLRTLEAAAARHLDALEQLHRTVATQATELAFEVAEAVVGRELALATDPGADAVRRALAAVPGHAGATARLHPDDLSRLGADPGELSPTAALQLVADPDVAPGDCVLVSSATTVDASISAALQRVRHALELPATPHATAAP